MAYKSLKGIINSTGCRRTGTAPSTPTGTRTETGTGTAPSQLGPHHVCAITIVLAGCVCMCVWVKRSTDKRLGQAEGKKLLMFDACLEQGSQLGAGKAPGAAGGAGDVPRERERERVVFK